MGLFDSIFPAKNNKEESTIAPTRIQGFLRDNDLKIPIPDETFASVDDFLESWTAPQTIILGILSVGAFGLGIAVGRRGVSVFRRITSVHSLSNIGPESQILKGRAVSVSDGDTLRFYHVPTWFHSSSIPDGAKMSELAMPVRICSIDTPEVAKFGKPSQPFGDDAKDYLSKHVLNKTIYVQVLQKDQYGRAVATVARPGWFGGRKYMDEIMLKAGLAEVYLGGGAVYGAKGKNYYLELMEMTKGKKKGIWSLKKRESAAEFKARMKEEQ